MRVKFDNCVVTGIRTGTSKKGYEYGILSFLTPDYDQFELFIDTDHLRCLNSLVPKTKVDSMVFDLSPDRSGGVRLVPTW